MKVGRRFLAVAVLAVKEKREGKVVSPECRVRTKGEKRKKTACGEEGKQD